MRLIITRPELDAVETFSRLQALGHSGISAPLLMIRSIAGAEIPEKNWQGVLATSANGVRAVARLPALPLLPTLPLLVVGEASAKMAVECGFSDIRSANGDLHDLVNLARIELLPEKGPLLYLSGSIISGDLKGELESAGFSVYRAVLYEAAAAVVLPDNVIAALMQDTMDGIGLFSRRSAEIWVRLVRKAGVLDQAQTLRHFCLSEAVAAAIRKAWPKNGQAPPISVAPTLDFEGFLQSLGKPL